MGRAPNWSSFGLKSREVDELPLLAVSRAPPWVTDGADAGGGAPDGTLLPAPPADDEAGAIVAGVAVLLVLLLSGFVVGVSVEPGAVVCAFAAVEDDATLADPVDGDAALAPDVDAAEEPFWPARMGAKVLVDTWIMSLPWTVRLSFDFLSSRVRVSVR